MRASARRLGGRYYLHRFAGLCGVVPTSGFDPLRRVVVFQAGGNDARQGQAGDSYANTAAIQKYVAAHGARLVTMGNLNSIAGQYRLADGQHYSAAGHIAFANSVLSEVRSALGC